MVKESAISIEFEPELKERLEREAAEQRISLAAHVQQILNAERPPLWNLNNPELSYSPVDGTAIKLSVAYDWPVALLSPEQAAKLGTDLLTTATAALAISKPAYKVYQSNNDPGQIAIVRVGRVPPRSFQTASSAWIELEPPSGVAPDIAIDIERAGVCYLRSTNAYRSGDFIGGGLRSTIRLSKI